MAPQDNGFSSTVTSVVTVTAPPSNEPTGGSSNNQNSNQDSGQNSDQNRPNDGNRNGNADSSGSGLSSRAEKIVIATTTIGGTLILILLFYALWRRRKGASYSEIVRFKSQSTVSTISQHPDNDHVTALPNLPIYTHHRFSIRSSRHPSLANLRNAKRAQAIPSPLRSDIQSPVVKTVIRKSSNIPRTPTMSGRMETFLEDASPEIVKAQEHARMPSRSIPTLNLPIMRQSEDNHQPISPSIDRGMQLPSPLASPELLNPQDRWSWTNSQAPSTPRIQPPNTRSSLTSTRMKNVASWVRGGGEQASSNKKRGKSRPLLKNQASHPILAPPSILRPSSRASKHGRVGSLSGIFKSNSKTHIPDPPLSPRSLEGQEPISTTNIEMSQKS